MILLLVLVLTGCDSIKRAMGKMNAKHGPAMEGGAVYSLTEADFDAFVAQGGVLVVVDFYADWCGPCKRLGPMMDKLAAEYGDRVVVGKLDIDAHGAVAARLGVKGIPDVRFFRDGKQVDKLVGLPPEREMRARFDRHSKGILARLEEEKGERDADTKAALQKPESAGQTEDQSEAKKPGSAKQGKAEEVPAKPKEPAMQPMKKDWMPPGMQRQ